MPYIWARAFVRSKNGMFHAGTTRLRLIVARLRAKAARNVLTYVTRELGTVKETEHRIDRNEGTFTILQQTYRADLKSREVFKENIQTQLDAGIIALAHIEWEDAVPLAPNNTGPCGSVWKSTASAQQ